MTHIFYMYLKSLKKVVYHIYCNFANVSSLRASFLVSNHITRAKKPFTVDEESILPAAKDICLELLGESAIQKITSVPLLASTISR